jgi:XXXCH domain-containing protein
MSESSDAKYEMQLSPADAAAFLRRLADQLEAGGARVGDVQVETDGQVKVKQSVKAKEDRASFKLKLKYYAPLTAELGEVVEGAESAASDEGSGSPGGGKPSYKGLKKRMGKSFKGIKKELAAGGPPDYAAVLAFCDDCVLMTSYPDQGEEHYADFDRLTGQLRRAATDADLEDCRRVVAEMEAMRKACHDQYK